MENKEKEIKHATYKQARAVAPRLIDIEKKEDYENLPEIPSKQKVSAFDINSISSNLKDLDNKDQQQDVQIEYIRELLTTISDLTKWNEVNFTTSQFLGVAWIWNTDTDIKPEYGYKIRKLDSMINEGSANPKDAKQTMIVNIQGDTVRSMNNSDILINTIRAGSGNNLNNFLEGTMYCDLGFPVLDYEKQTLPFLGEYKRYIVAGIVSQNENWVDVNKKGYIKYSKTQSTNPLGVKPEIYYCKTKDIQNDSRPLYTASRKLLDGVIKLGKVSELEMNYLWTQLKINDAQIVLCNEQREGGVNILFRRYANGTGELRITSYVKANNGALDPLLNVIYITQQDFARSLTPYECIDILEKANKTWIRKEFEDPTDLLLNQVEPKRAMFEIKINTSKKLYNNDRRWQYDSGGNKTNGGLQGNNSQVRV